MSTLQGTYYAQEPHTLTIQERKITNMPNNYWMYVTLSVKPGWKMVINRNGTPTATIYDQSGEERAHLQLKYTSQHGSLGEFYVPDQSPAIEGVLKHWGRDHPSPKRARESEENQESPKRPTTDAFETAHSLLWNQIFNLKSDGEKKLFAGCWTRFRETTYECEQKGDRDYAEAIACVFINVYSLIRLLVLGSRLISNDWTYPAFSKYSMTWIQKETPFTDEQTYVLRFGGNCLRFTWSPTVDRFLTEELPKDKWMKVEGSEMTAAQKINEIKRHLDKGFKLGVSKQLATAINSRVHYLESFEQLMTKIH